MGSFQNNQTWRFQCIRGGHDLQDWLLSGWVDVVLSYAPAPRVGQVVQAVTPEHLVLSSDRSDSPIAYDSGYVFVDYGEMYRRQHGEAYYDAGTAKSVLIRRFGPTSR